MRELIPEHQGERFSFGWPEAGDRRGQPVTHGAIPPGAVRYGAVCHGPVCHGAVCHGAVDESLVEAMGGFQVGRAFRPPRPF